MMETLIKAGGIYNIALIVFHLFFWRIFHWREDLQSLSFLNRAIFPVVNLSLTFVFVIFAYISLTHTIELLSTPLGNSLLIFISLFWFARALMQIIYFKLDHWASFAFLLFFLAGAAIYGIPAAYHIY